MVNDKMVKIMKNVYIQPETINQPIFSLNGICVGSVHISGEGPDLDFGGGSSTGNPG